MYHNSINSHSNFKVSWETFYCQVSLCSLSSLDIGIDVLIGLCYFRHAAVFEINRARYLKGRIHSIQGNKKEAIR